MSHYLYLSLVHFAHLPMKVAPFFSPLFYWITFISVFRFFLCFCFCKISIATMVILCLTGRMFIFELQRITAHLFSDAALWRKTELPDELLFSVNVLHMFFWFFFFYWSKTCIRSCDQANSSRCHAATGSVLWRSVPGLFLFYVLFIQPNLFVLLCWFPFWDRHPRTNTVLSLLYYLNDWHIIVEKIKLFTINSDICQHVKQS